MSGRSKLRERHICLLVQLLKCIAEDILGIDRSLIPFRVLHDKIPSRVDLCRRLGSDCDVDRIASVVIERRRRILLYIRRAVMLTE